MRDRFQIFIVGIALLFCSADSCLAREAVREDETNNRLIIDCEDSGRSSRLVQGQRRKPAAEDARARGAFRAELFFGEEAGSEEDRQVKAVFNDAGLVELADCECEGESGVDGEEDSKRESKRSLSHKIFISKCRVLSCLSKKSLSKGFAKHPESQDAEQERTAAVRFLLICALA